MPRVRSKTVRRSRHKKWLKQAKGFWGKRKNLYSVARVASMKAMAYATRDRRVKKRSFRRLWIVRITAACHNNGTSYNKFLSSLKKNKIYLNRKILAEIATHDSNAFDILIKDTITQ